MSILTRILHWLPAGPPPAPEPWTEPRVVELLARMRTAASFLQDPLILEAVEAMEWLRGERRRR